MSEITPSEAHLSKIATRYTASTLIHFGSAARTETAASARSPEARMNMTARIAQAAEEYRMLGQQARIGTGVVMAGDALVAGALFIPAATVALGLPQIAALAVLSRGMGDLFDFTISTMDQVSRDSADKVLGAHLARLSIDVREDLDNLLNTEEPRASVIQKILEADGGVLGLASVESLPPEARPIFNGYLSEVLNLKLEAGLRLTASEIEQLVLSDDVLAAEISTLSQESQALSLLAQRNATQTSEIADAISAITEEIQATGTKVDFLTDVAYRFLTPSEQLAYLTRRGRLSADDAKAYEAEISRATMRKEFLEVTGKMLGAASNAAGILRDLGAKGNTLDSLENGIRVGEAAFSAFAAWTASDYPAAVRAVTSIVFGGRAKGIAAQRHRQITDQLDRLVEMQQDVLDELERIRGDLNEIRSLQVQTLVLLEYAITESREQRRQIIDSILASQMLISSSTELVSEQGWRDVGKLRLFLSLRTPLAVGDMDIGLAEDLPLPWADIESHFSAYRLQFIDGFTASLVVLHDPRVNAILRAVSYVRQDGVGAATEKQFERIKTQQMCMRLWIECHSADANKSLGATLQALSPNFRLGCIDPRASALEHMSPVEHGSPASLVKWIFSSADIILAWPAVVELVEPLISSHWYHQVLDGDWHIRPLAELFGDMKPVSATVAERGLVSLLLCQRIVGLAIVQETVVVGEGIVPKILQEIEGTGASAELAVKLLASLPSLRKNLICYLLRRRIGAADVYRSACQTFRGDFFRSKILRMEGRSPAHWKIVWVYEGKYVVPATEASPEREEYWADMTRTERSLCSLPNDVLVEAHKYWTLEVDVNGECVSLPFPPPEDLLLDAPVAHSPRLVDMLQLMARIDNGIAEYRLRDLCAEPHVADALAMIISCRLCRPDEYTLQDNTGSTETPLPP